MAEATLDQMAAKVDFECFTEDELKSIREAVAGGGMDAYVKFLQEKQDEWKTLPLNIAVIGSSGVGKSSFINAIRSVTADDPEAAEVGCNEITFKIRSYPHPNNEMLKLWDMPGVGTSNFSKETYLEEVQVERFDFFLLLSASRFTETETWLRNEIVEKLGKQLFYVRTKIDDDVKSRRKAHPRTHNEDVVLAEIRTATLANLEAVGSEHTKVFLIDNYKQQKYDFHQLQQSMINDFPEIKRQALILSLSAFSDHLIKTKADVLRKRIGRSAALSAGVAFIPLQGVSIAFDAATTLVMAKYYYQQVGLDEISLNRHAQLTSSDPRQLQRVVQEALGDDFLTIQGIKNLISGFAGAGVVAAAISEEFCRFIPVICGIVAGALSFGGTYLTHKIMIDQLEKVALLVFRYAVEHSVHTDGDDE